MYKEVENSPKLNELTNNLSGAVLQKEVIMNQTHTLIVGAGISGLACASSLQKQGIEYIIIENFSNLPYKKFGTAIPRYPSRQQVVAYLDDYQEEFNINPLLILKQN